MGLTVVSSLTLSNSRAFFTPQASLAAAVLPGAGQGALLPDQAAMAAFLAPPQMPVGNGINAGQGPRNATPAGLPASVDGGNAAGPSGAVAPPSGFTAPPAAQVSPSSLGGIPAGSGGTGPNVSTNPGMPSGQTPGAGVFPVTTNPTTPLPEPETWAMMAMGLGFVSIMLYRQRRRSALA